VREVYLGNNFNTPMPRGVSEQEERGLLDG
jgi:hypothetical protein